MSWFPWFSGRGMTEGEHKCKAFNSLEQQPKLYSCPPTGHSSPFPSLLVQRCVWREGVWFVALKIQATERLFRPCPHPPFSLIRRTLALPTAEHGVCVDVKEEVEQVNGASLRWKWWRRSLVLNARQRGLPLTQAAGILLYSYHSLPNPPYRYTAISSIST